MAPLFQPTEGLESYVTGLQNFNSMQCKATQKSGDGNPIQAGIGIGHQHWSVSGECKGHVSLKKKIGLMYSGPVYLYIV